jgi:nicotinate-nucleotide adenylyltransferase
LRFGLIGGTFDPVHLGHLIGAEFAADRLGLERLYFVPAAHPPHKSLRSITPADHRVNMLRLAMAGNQRFDLWLDEIERGGQASYTIDTLRRFRGRMGQEAEVYFILGADNLAEFNTWKDWRQIAAECRIVALAREGFNGAREGVREQLDGVDFTWIEMPLIGISATQIRDACRAGRSIRYLVPDPVADYIARNSLYTGSRS